MILHRTASLVAAGAALALLSTTATAQNPDEKSREKPPQLTVRSSPAVVFAPGRVVVTAEFKGGPDDYEDYYCPKVEWDWADGSTSTAEYDCDPYEAGKSEIRRRYTQDHTYREPGSYEVTFRLKQGSKVVVAGRVTIDVRGDAGRATASATGRRSPAGS